MHMTIEHLRMWIVAAGVVLVVVIVTSFLYVRYRVGKFERDLPAKLGLQIERSTNDFTVSRSKAGHTQFVLHAAKAVQFKGGGHLVLHDVSILLYGKDGSQADRLEGSQFDYDQATGIARADGTVDIEMAEPMTDVASKAAKLKAPVPEHMPAGPVRIKTSGLVFNQKTQVATTDQALTFADGAASGSALGGTYDGENGTLALAHSVVVHTSVAGHDGSEPVSVQAQSANFNRGLRQLVLIKSLTDYHQDHQTADQSTVYFRTDGSAEHVTAEGNVRIITDSGSDLKAGRAYAQLDEQSHLQQLRLSDGVLLIAHQDSAKNGQQTLHANSNSGILSFDKNELEHLHLSQAVSVVDEQEGLPGDARGSETREMRASKLDVSFGPASSPSKGLKNPEKTEPNSLLATGDATMTVHIIHTASPEQSTTLKADQLFATLVDGRQVSSLRGDGHTYLLQESPGGISQTSRGDTLLVNFAPQTTNKTAATPKANPDQISSQIASAIQKGNVALAELQPAHTPGGPPVKTTATADTVTFDGATGRIDLSGGTPHIDQEGSDLTAGAVEFNRKTGDASASGGVKATYVSPAANPAANPPAKGEATQEVMHIVADHASLDHASDETTFLAALQDAPHSYVRLWEGPNSITAPTIVLSRNRQLLTAKGPPNSVKATFAEGGSSKPGKEPTIMRIVSGSLVYSGGERKATFSNGVLAQGSSGTMHAAGLEVYLKPVGPPAAKAPTTPAMNQSVGPGGQVDRIVASGHIDLQQGERRCIGDHLVYTAEDQRFVLTGTSAAPPRVTDPVHGTVTGGSLIFNNRDDSVIVSRGQSATVTDTRTTK